ncbi:MAG: Hsp70 family protein [Acidobacteriota bacterium]
MAEKGLAIGIDLGTTNSVCAIYDNTARVLASERADGLVPSVVVFWRPPKDPQAEGKILVGQPALDFAYKDPRNAIFSIKRLMGRSYNEPKVTEVHDRMSYSIVRATHSDDSGVRVLLGEKEYTPVEISAFILKEIKKHAERALGQPVTHAVITVPAYFEERQRAATRQAGEKAGLIVKKIIDEPSAAAIAYGFTVSQGKRQRLLVFDLGGGTFDVSIIYTVMDPEGKNHFEVFETRGDNWLGGDDFDEEIVREIASAIEKEYGFNPSGDKMFRLLAKQAAERAKIALSNVPDTYVTFPAAYKTPDDKFVDLNLPLTSKHFEKLIQPLVERCMKHVKEALNGQGLMPDDINKVLMVGGSTLVPLVYQMVTDYFGKDKVQIVNPYHTVALGAGILAATLQGIQCPNAKCKHINDEASENCEKCGDLLAAAVSVGGISIGEITAVSFGISAVRENESDAFEVIIPKGTPYPLSRAKTKTFETTRDNYICVPVYEGLNPVATNNNKQGEILLNEEDFHQLGENVPSKTPVEISMNYTRDRELQLKVRVHGTKVEKDVKLLHDRPYQTSPVGPQADLKWREEIEQLLQIAENFRGKYMGYMESRELARLERDIGNAQNALDMDNAVAGREAYNTLLVALDSCGVASLLLMAERVQESASPERAAKMGEVISKIKVSWFQQDKQSVALLTTPLRTVIAAELNARRSPGMVPGQEDFGGRLRVKK